MAWLIAAAMLVPAGFCVYLAEEKNRNSTVWGVLGLLFGIFALIATAGLPVGPPPNPRETVDRESMRSALAQPWNPMDGPPPK
jgi:hypothetical protein